jgi:trans-aconitate 2-methyltransferase
MPVWSATQYLKFGEERTRPCRDLAARIALTHVRRAIDLGCGPGNSTAVLADRWPDAELTGLDGSPEMIETARQSYPAHRWVLGDIPKWAAAAEERFDVVFSNAALQWVTDHAANYPRILDRVADGGALAIQIPAYADAPCQNALREMASVGRLREVETWHTHEPPFYYDALAPLAKYLDMWETTYLHVMPNVEAIVEWYKGSALRPYLQALDSPAEGERFLAEYLDRIRPHYMPRPDGRVLFPFRRIFAIAYR